MNELYHESEKNVQILIVILLPLQIGLELDHVPSPRQVCCEFPSSVYPVHKVYSIFIDFYGNQSSCIFLLSLTIRIWFELRIIGHTAINMFNWIMLFNTFLDNRSSLQYHHIDNCFQPLYPVQGNQGIHNWSLKYADFYSIMYCFGPIELLNLISHNQTLYYWYFEFY